VPKGLEGFRELVPDAGNRTCPLSVVLRPFVTILKDPSVVWPDDRPSPFL